MQNSIENPAKKYLDLVDKYCLFIAIRRCFCDDEILKNHLISVTSQLPEDRARFLLDKIKINFIKIAEETDSTKSSEDCDKELKLSKFYSKIYDTPIDNFRPQEIINAVNVTCTQESVYSLDCSKDKYELIKENSPLEFARRFVIESRKLKKNDKINSSSQSNLPSR
jgi:hypothetical protein